MHDHDQIVTLPSHILGILRRLHTNHALVSIQHGDDSCFYPTIILDINPDEHTLLIDATENADWHCQLSTGAAFQMLGRLSGIQVHCEIIFQERIKESSSSSYRVMMPRQLLYKQRRRHFRAVIEKNKSLSINLPLSMKQHIKGQVVDISVSGICTRVDFSEATSLASDQAIRHARIALPDKQMLTCDLTLRSVRHYPEKGFSLIGGEFNQIQPQQQHHIERLVAALDRDQRRRNDISI